MLEIVIPLYKPVKDWEKNIKERVESLQQFIAQPVNLILINDGPSDVVVERGMLFLKKYFSNLIILHSEQNFGKGHALRMGLAQAKSDKIIVTDVDFPFSEDSYIQVYQALQGDCDIILGKRSHEYYKGLPGSRRIISRLFTKVSGFIIGNKTDGDTQAGIKGMNNNGREAFLKTKTNGYLTDFEFLLLASRSHFKLCAVPVKVEQHKTGSLSFKILMRELRDFIRIVMS